MLCALRQRSISASICAVLTRAAALAPGWAALLTVLELLAFALAEAEVAAPGDVCSRQAASSSNAAEISRRMELGVTLRPLPLDCSRPSLSR